MINTASSASPWIASTGTVSGGPAPAADLIGFQPATYWADFTISDTGTLIYNSNPGASLSELVWIDRTGKRLGVLGQTSVMCNPSISPDGSRVSVDITDQKANNVDIWLLSTNNSGSTRFTFAPEEEVAGVWSRDGHKIVYRSNISAGSGLLLQPANGLGETKTLIRYKGTDDIIPNSWSPDDQKILASHSTPSGDLSRNCSGFRWNRHSFSFRHRQRIHWNDFSRRKMGGVRVR